MTRIEREKIVVAQMIAIYCRSRHGRDYGELCPECGPLLEYALRRLERCPKGNDKSSCRNCEIHCYAPDKREAIRQVMRYAGPRMLLIHPVSAIRHLIGK